MLSGINFMSWYANILKCFSGRDHKIVFILFTVKASIKIELILMEIYFQYLRFMKNHKPLINMWVCVCMCGWIQYR